MVRALIAIGALAAVLAAGCGGDDGVTTTTTAPEPTGTTVVSGSVIFGEGTLPATVPESFPIPGSAAIGDTLEDTTTGRTEVVIVIAGEPENVVGDFEESLPEAGFEVLSSTREGASHVIEFSGEGVTGMVKVTVGSVGATTVALTVVPSA